MTRRALPDKLFFRIGEVAALVGVKAHVLRYWEEELGVLVPMKTRGAHRQYRRRDVETALRIREMLQEEGLTLSGVKKRLREQATAAKPNRAPSIPPLDSTRDAELRLRAALVEVRADLVALAASLGAPPAFSLIDGEGEQDEELDAFDEELDAFDEELDAFDEEDPGSEDAIGEEDVLVRAGPAAPRTAKRRE